MGELNPCAQIQYGNLVELRSIDNSHHWFLLAVQPPLQCVLALDSMPGSFIKPTVYKTIEVIKLMKEIDGNLKVEEWWFYAKKPGDIPSQINDYDCGVVTCMPEVLSI